MPKTNHFSFGKSLNLFDASIDKSQLILIHWFSFSFRIKLMVVMVIFIQAYIVLIGTFISINKMQCFFTTTRRLHVFLVSGKKENDAMSDTISLVSIIEFGGWNSRRSDFTEKSWKLQKQLCWCGLLKTEHWKNRLSSSSVVCLDWFEQTFHKLCRLPYEQEHHWTWGFGRKGKSFNLTKALDVYNFIVQVWKLLGVIKKGAQSNTSDLHCIAFLDCDTK